MGTTPPNNNLVWGILTTLFCCLPLGIVSIVKAAEVNTKWGAGDHAGAQASADDAMKWAKYAAIAGVVWIVFCVILAMVMVGGLVATGTSTNNL
jgi:hypothetical protein